MWQGDGRQARPALIGSIADRVRNGLALGTRTILLTGRVPSVLLVTAGATVGFIAQAVLNQPLTLR